jgi:EF-hand domain-containing protein 1
MYGDRRPYVVHYYLADDTMEVLEAHEMNSGRDPFPVFIARAPMPRTFTQPGFTVSKRVDKRQCLAPADLRIGCAVTLHNRTMLLYACDAFTRKWYMDNLGYTAEELTDMNIREEVRALSSTTFMMNVQQQCTRRSFPVGVPSLGCRFLLQPLPLN